MVEVIRDRDTLIHACAQGFEPKWLFFFGHDEPKKGVVTKKCLSQWYDSPFEVGGMIYQTAEHYMMAGKAKLFEDEDIWTQIIACAHPGEAKKLGRKVRGFDEERWKNACVEIVTQGNVAKFFQNERLRDFLIRTEHAVLVEASPRDRIWGIGLSEHHKDAPHPESWRGANLLGFALMEARARLLAQG